jgi:hypothetical protein
MRTWRAPIRGREARGTQLHHRPSPVRKDTNTPEAATSSAQLINRCPGPLRRVLQRHEPGRAWPVTGVLTVAALALLGWLVVVPLLREHVRAEVPTTNDLARLCDGGDGFRSLPAHRATGYGVGEGSAGQAEVLYLFLAATTAA